MDVVIAGAGPVGLLLAAELRTAGVSVLVLERAPDEVAPIKEGEMGARSLNAPSAFALHHRGLLPAVREQALWWFDPTEIQAPAGPPVFVGHFAGIGLRAELIDPDDAEITAHRHGAGAIPIGAFERLLRRHATELGARIEYATPLTALTQDAEGVTVRAGEREIRAGWLVGCDGGRSTVRKLGGFAFPGADPTTIARQVLVDLTDPEALLPGGLHVVPAGSYILGGWQRRLRPTRLVLMEPMATGQPPADRDAPVTAAEIEASIERLTGRRHRVTAIHAASRYTDHTRQATEYRDGRVLLAGDAAHVHSPAGGQGLNLGLGDAVNLGWKLAATINGRARPGLLDSYRAERHPLGAWVQSWSMAQSALAGTDPHTAALRGVVADLLNSTPSVMYVLKKISGVAQRYDLGGGHPLVGAPCPEATGAQGQPVRLADAARFVLLYRPGALDPDACAAWSDRLHTYAIAEADPIDADLLLVRPDGYVALARRAPVGPLDWTELLGSAPARV